MMDVKSTIQTLQGMVHTRDAHIEELIAQKSELSAQIVELQRRGREDWRKEVVTMVTESVCAEHSERLSRMDRTEQALTNALEALEKVPAWVRRWYKAAPKPVNGYTMEVDLEKRKAAAGA